MAEKYRSIPAYSGYFFTKTTHHDAPNKLDPAKVKLPAPFIVCITGGGRGLGEAYALAFAKAGASGIILTARSAHELEGVAEKIGNVSDKINVSVVTCDVTLEANVHDLAEEIRREHGRLDVLINNAGYLDAGWQPTTDIAADDWKRVFDVNVYGVFLVSRTLIPLLLNSLNGAKTVIGISSMSSHFAAPSVAMGMSKLAMNRFMEYLGGPAGYASEGLMAYSLHPGGVPTKMSQDPAKVPKDLSAMCQDTPELSAAMAVWLAKEPRPWLSGRYVAANWDTDELEAQKDEIVREDKLKFRMVV